MVIVLRHEFIAVKGFVFSAKCDMRIALMWQITGRVLIIVRGSVYKAYHKCTASMCLKRDQKACFLVLRT